MTDYISREAAINRLKEAIPYHDNSITGLERAIGYLQAIPAADVRPVVRGKWELQEDLLTWEGAFDGYFCSKCGKGYLNDLCCGNGEHYVDVTKEFNFCPNCGAYMREE